MVDIAEASEIWELSDKDRRNLSDETFKWLESLKKQKTEGQLHDGK